MLLLSFTVSAAYLPDGVLDCLEVLLHHFHRILAGSQLEDDLQLFIVHALLVNQRRKAMKHRASFHPFMLNGGQSYFYACLLMGRDVHQYLMRRLQHSHHEWQARRLAQETQYPVFTKFSMNSKEKVLKLLQPIVKGMTTIFVYLCIVILTTDDDHIFDTTGIIDAIVHHEGHVTRP